MKPRMNYEILRKGGRHEKSRKAKRQEDKKNLKKGNYE